LAGRRQPLLRPWNFRCRPSEDQMIELKLTAAISGG
jgi:hypothetical protein